MNEAFEPWICVLGQFRFSDIPFPNTVDQWIDTLTTPFSLTLFAVGFFGLFIGWLLGRSAPRERVRDTDFLLSVGKNSDLEWRHEKLVLLERQEADLHDRVQCFVSAIPESDPAIGTELKGKLFGLAEQMRELRQRVGSDLSRLGRVRDRLIELRSQDVSRQEAIAMGEEMATSQIIQLEEMREQLREPTRTIGEISDDWDPSSEFTSDSRDELVEKLADLQESIRELPIDLPVLTEETDGRIRELLKAGGEPEFQSILRVLLVDGAVTPSRKNHNVSPGEQLRNILDRLRGWEAVAEEETEKPEDPNQYRLTLPIVPLSPDQGFQPPLQAGHFENGNGNGSHPEPEEEQVDSKPESETQVVFRSNQPEDWGKTLYLGQNRRARELSTIPTWAEWISMERTDTGERVFVPVSSYLTSSDGISTSFGFNASREKFYGANHLGVFADSCPNEVETRFTYGGWGFGHRVAELGEGRMEPQASGWAGKEISSDTVFAVCLHASLPETSDQDLVLGGKAVGDRIALDA